MKIINQISSDNILSIDIETVRLTEHYSELSEDYKAAWEYKNKQEGVVPDEEVLADLWVKSASLWPEFSKICSVAIAYLKGNELRCKQYTSNFEHLILEDLANDLNLFKKSKPTMRLVGHASKHFDYPFLCKRYIINRMDIPDILDESLAKPWEQTLLCTNELWKSFGSFSNSGSSLQALCVALDVPTSKVDLVGDQVGKAFFENKLVDIGTYCSLDTIATFNVFRRFKKEPIFLFSEVVYTNKDVVLQPGDVKSLNGKLFDQIISAKSISETNKKKIQKVVLDLTPDEKNNLLLILKACLQNNPSKEDFAFLLTL